MQQTEIHRLQADFEYFTRLTVSRDTATRYAKALTYFFSCFTDRTAPQEFTRRDIEDFRIWRLRKGLACRTVNYEVGVVRAFYNWLMQQDLISWNPASQVKRLREKEAPRTSLSLAEQQALQKGCYQWGDKALLVLALTTGLRGETLCDLEKHEFNFERNCITIPAEKMKTARNHEIPLPAWVMPLIKEAPDGRIFAGYAKNAGSIRYRWNCICRRAGVPLNGIRTARRTFATTLLRSGTDLKIVQDLLGHRNITTTSRYLTPADNQTVRTAVERLPVLEDMLE